MGSFKSSGLAVHGLVPILLACSLVGLVKASRAADSLLELANSETAIWPLAEQELADVDNLGRRSIGDVTPGHAWHGDGVPGRAVASLTHPQQTRNRSGSSSSNKSGNKLIKSPTWTNSLSTRCRIGSLSEVSKGSATSHGGAGGQDVGDRDTEGGEGRLGGTEEQLFWARGREGGQWRELTGTERQSSGAEGQSRGAQVHKPGEPEHVRDAQGSTQGAQEHGGGAKARTGKANRRILEEHVQSLGAQGQGLGAQGQTAGLQGQSLGARGQGLEAKGQNLGAQGQVLGAQGPVLGAQGQALGAQEQSPGLQSKIFGPMGLAEGARLQELAAQRRTVGAQGPTSEAQAQILGAQGQNVSQSQTLLAEGPSSGTQGQGLGAQGQKLEAGRASEVRQVDGGEENRDVKAVSGFKGGVQPGDTGIVKTSELMACDLEQQRPYFFQSLPNSTAFRAGSGAVSDHGDVDKVAELIQGRKFWLLAMSAEQLTKGIMHFVEASLLAKQHGLISLHSRVQSSIISPFGKYEMCLYFDIESLSFMGDWISLSFFTKVLRHAKRKGEAVHAMMLKSNCPDPQQKRSWPAFMDKPLDGNLAVYHMHCFNHSAAIANKPLLDAFVEGHLVQAGPERILFAEYKLSPTFYFPQDEVMRMRDSVRFAPHLHRAVDKLVARKGRNFLAIQWRMEKSIHHFERNTTGDMQAHVQACSQALIDTVKRLQAGGDSFDWVFLATDVQGDGSFSSNTLNVGPSKDPLILKRAEGIRCAVSMRKLLESKLRPVTWSGIVPGFKEVDSGVQGVLDTLVCSKAKLFLHPPLSCGFTWSSYTNHIVRLRGSQAASKPWDEAAA